MTAKFFLGVDPGTTGAYAIYDGDRGQMHSVEDLPSQMVKVSGRSGEKPRLAPYLLKDQLAWMALNVSMVAWIERVSAMPKQGSASTFTFAEAYGQIQGVLAGVGIRFEIVPPTVWQPLVQLKRGRTKDEHRELAAKLFPNFAAAFQRKMDHDRADAALIAYAAYLTSRMTNGT